MNNYKIKLLNALMSRGPVSCLILFIQKLIHFVLKIVIWILRLIVRLLDRTVFKGLLFVTRYIDYPFRGLAKKYLAKRVPIQKNKVVFLTFQGSFSCNPRMIAEKLLEDPRGLEIVWVYKGEIPLSDYPVGMRFVKYNTMAFYQELASAQVIIENTNLVERLQVYKKPEQFLFQTWHGSLGIKRLDGDVVKDFRWKRNARLCQKYVDYLLSNSDFETEVFHTAYWTDVPVLLTGHARNDIFFWDDDRKEAVIQKVYDYLKLPREKRLFLYAPTHSDNVNENFVDLPYEEILLALRERFGGDWQIVVRVHNRLKRQSRKWFRSLPDCVSNATMYDDMQDLLVAADAGLTDYSSWIFDYMLSRKPAFFITLNFDVFSENRGFYYPMESTPFPIAANETELIENIRSFDEEKYVAGVDAFLKDKGCMEDGHASERIADKIYELTGSAEDAGKAADVMDE